MSAKTRETTQINPLVPESGQLLRNDALLTGLCGVLPHHRSPPAASVRHLSVTRREFVVLSSLYRTNNMELTSLTSHTLQPYC